jgi:hypothetical protein
MSGVGFVCVIVLHVSKCRYAACLMCTTHGSNHHIGMRRRLLVHALHSFLVASFVVHKLSCGCVAAGSLLAELLAPQVQERAGLAVAAMEEVAWLLMTMLNRFWHRACCVRLAMCPVVSSLCNLQFLK